MHKADAYISAKNMLDLLIQNQPSLLADTNGNARAFGSNVADFCHDFIEQYAKRLMERTEQK